MATAAQEGKGRTMRVFRCATGKSHMRLRAQELQKDQVAQAAPRSTRALPSEGGDAGEADVAVSMWCLSLDLCCHLSALTANQSITSIYGLSSLCLGLMAVTNPELRGSRLAAARPAGSGHVRVGLTGKGGG